MENTTTTNNVFASLLASACAAILLTACGGTPEGDTPQSPSRTNAQATFNAGSKASANDYSFGNFNPGIWNEHNWYECNCGRNPTTPPVSTPWKTAG